MFSASTNNPIYVTSINDIRLGDQIIEEEKQFI